PHICPLYEMGEIEGRPFITLAYLDGESLATRLACGPMDVAEAVNLVRTLADALDEAHRSGIVHRDLKPSNILFNSKGQPAITDFGLARRLAPLSSESLTSELLAGTPAYMAPEQINGDAAIGPATDVYALGVVLYETLTRTRPFEGPLGSLMAQITTNDPEPPSRRRPDIDPALSNICLKAIEKKPQNRFQSMAEFKNALDEWERPNLPRPKKRTRALRRFATRVAASASLAAAALLIWQPWKQREQAT